MSRLDFIFGDESHGDTPEERARTSDRIFVRSQVQLALDSEAASGRRMSAEEALSSFGLNALESAIAEGSTTFLAAPDEPARTLRKRRQYLKLSHRSLADMVGTSIEVIRRIETPGEILPAQIGERIAQELALDERFLGVVAMSRADLTFAARLRDLKPEEPRADFFVTALSGAGWTIRRQADLQKMLGFERPAKIRLVGFDNDYSYPTYEHGYELAERTRALLDIAPTAPIASMYELIERALAVPLVHADLGTSYAGATIVNANARGIAITLDGANANIVVRRMTLAHELGHLLWDHASKLEAIRVEHSSRRGDVDPVEIRANAFAVALLAPRAGVEAIYQAEGSSDSSVARLVDEYGIFPTAAARHLANVCGLRFEDITYNRTMPSAVRQRWAKSDQRDDWADDLVRQVRAGRFSRLVLAALADRRITPDTAMAWLRIDVPTLSLLRERSAS